MAAKTPKIVVVTNSFITDYLLEELKKRGQLQLKSAFHDDPEGYKKALAECEIAIASGGTHFGQEDYVLCPKLKLIADFGVGYDGIDIEAANQHRVLVSHTPNVLNDDVADLALALILNVTRGLVGSHNYCVQGRWAKEGPYPLKTAAHHQKVGIVGLGRIGLEIARRCEAFKMEISYTARHPRDVPYTYFEDILSLAHHCSILILALPASKESYHLVNAEVLKALGPEGFLINIARGAVVDTQALIAALKDGTIKGTGLDVFEHEPHIEQELLDLDNVVLSPHVGSATSETRHAMADLVLANVDAYLAGQPLVSRVKENTF